MHVPPGIDSYREESADGKSAAASLWTEAFLGRYLELVGKYRPTVQVSFAGHTHMDDFRLDLIEGKPVLLHKIVPSVSPVFGNNPAFQVYQFERKTGALTDWQTYFLNLTISGRPTAMPTWDLEYDAMQAYRLPAINAMTAAALFDRIRDNPAGREAANYRKFFRVRARPIAEPHLPIYGCAVLKDDYAGYSACVSGHNLPVPIEMDNPAKLRRMAGGLGDPKR